MANDQFKFFGGHDEVMGDGARTSAGLSSPSWRRPFNRPLSLQETVSRAGAYALGIAGLCCVTYLCLYISEMLHG